VGQPGIARLPGFTLHVAEVDHGFSFRSRLARTTGRRPDLIAFGDGTRLDTTGLKRRPTESPLPARS
jgi:hypothetical protein